MRKGYTDITMILDRSGSMHSIWNDTIGGINSYISQQKALPGECRFTLVAFDSLYERPYASILVDEMPVLHIPTAFDPRGSTALLDAIGRTITETGQWFATMAEHARPETVLFCIVTDGYENASTEYKQEQIKEMIKHQTEKYGWDFSYLGANQDAIKVAGGYGILAGKSMSFAPNAAGASAAFTASATYANTARSAGTAAAAFTDEDKVAQAKAGLTP